MNTNHQGMSVVLPNYNGQSLLQKNLPSLYDALNNCNAPYEIIVVDDCSSDNSVSFLNNIYPDIIVISKNVNQGFSATCNTGITAAKLPLLCIANTDVTFTDDYFANALSAFKDSDLFAVKGDIINYRDNLENIIVIEKAPVLRYRRGFLRFDHNVEPNGKLLTGKLNGHFVLLGCCFICDRKKMLKLNGFDEIFSPFYWEDSDLALRATERGYNLSYLPQCKVYHQTSSTINTCTKKSKRQLVSNRNKFLFTWRHLYGIINWSLHIFHMLLNVISRWVILDWKFYTAFFRALFRYFSFPNNNLKCQ